MPSRAEPPAAVDVSGHELPKTVDVARLPWKLTVDEEPWNADEGW